MNAAATTSASRVSCLNAPHIHTDTQQNAHNTQVAGSVQSARTKLPESITAPEGARTGHHSQP